MAKRILFLSLVLVAVGSLPLVALVAVFEFKERLASIEAIAGSLNAVSQLFIAVSIFGGGIWALWVYANSRRSEAVVLIRNLFQDFYLSHQFDRIRSMIEYDYDKLFERILIKRTSNRDLSLSEDERIVLRELDGLLNYFEALLLLEEQGRMRKSDRIALFEYWFDLFSHDEKAALRRYVLLGFERVARELGVSKPDFVFVDTSERLNRPKPQGLLLSRARRAFIHGSFVERSGTRGMQRDPDESYGGTRNISEGVLVPIAGGSETAALAALDEKNDYKPGDESASRLLRRRVRVYDSESAALTRAHARGRDAWIYVVPPAETSPSATNLVNLQSHATRTQPR